MSEAAVVDPRAAARNARVDPGDALPLTIPRLLRERAEELGERVFTVCDDASLTYREAERRSARLARALLAAGVGRGAHIGLLYPNGPDFVVGWLAAARIGAVAVPFSTLSKPAELAVLLRGADVELLLAARAHRSHDYERALAEAVPGVDLAAAGPVLAPSAPVLRRIHVRAPSPALHPQRSLDALLALADGVGEDVLAAVEADVAPSDAMVIVHTSGSTSEPKGVVYAHGPLIRHLDNLNALRRYGRDEILFSSSPWFWIGGFAYALLGTLVAGARLVCSNAPDAEGVLDVLERERPTLVNGFAQSVAHLPQDPTFARRDLSSIRRGNLWPILPDAVRPKDPALRHGMLGMTETGSVCLLSPDEEDQPESRRGSFGRPAPGFETRIVDFDSGRPCAPGETGELQLRSPFLMEGYHGRERHEAFEPDGWFRTGDLFSVDADGFHYFHGRRGDLIKTAGANVSPREVEAVLADAAGLRAHVVGLDDAERGQRVAAAIVSDAPVDLAAVEALLRARLSSYKVPRTFLVLSADRVPMLSSGKLDLRGLKALFEARDAR
jgi:acyl-CoA synthetase (AMP-forming)/AMP-acid ligase II